MTAGTEPAGAETGNPGHPNRVACTAERGDKLQGQCGTLREERWRKSRRRRGGGVGGGREKEGGRGGRVELPLTPFLYNLALLYSFHSYRFPSKLA